MAAHQWLCICHQLYMHRLTHRPADDPPR